MAHDPEYHEEAVSGLWRSKDMALVRFQFERDHMRRDLLRVGQLGVCQFRNENTGDPDSPDPRYQQPHKEHVQGVKDAETLDRQCRFFRDQLAKWKHLRQKKTDPQSMPEGAGTWHDEPLDLDKVGSRRPDGRGGWSFYSVAEHEKELKGGDREGESGGLLKGFNDWRDRFKEWYIRSKVLESRMIEAVCSGERAEFFDSHSRAMVIAGAVPRSKLQVFLRMHQRRSRGKAELDPRCDARGMPEEGFDAVQSIPLPDCCEIIGYQSAGSDAQDLVYDVMYNEAGQPEDWVIFVSLTFSEVVKQRVQQLCQVQEAKLAVLSLSQDEQRRAAESKWRPQGVGELDDFALPQSREELMRMRKVAQDQMRNILEILQKTKRGILGTLDVVAPCLEQWEQIACVHKSVAYTMGMMRGSSGMYWQGMAWCPADKVALVHRHLSAEPRGAKIFTVGELTRADKKQRPTFFETSQYTSVFQGIVDSYGTPRYKEVNPAIFTVITFPYLFGVMYGDIGHGLIITAAATLLVLFEAKLAGVRNEMFQMIFGARYLLLAMGMFATFVGFLYNDFFGIMLEYSPSRYRWPDGWERMGTSTSTVDPICHADGSGPCATQMAPQGGPTPFGFDVAWMETGNKIDFYNSFKEKHAVILGVTQMTLGLLLQCLNHLYFAKETGDYKRIFFGFIPETIFLSCTFGYMCYIIIYKWVHPPRMHNTNLAPNLLETMTNFFLSPGGGPNIKPGAELYAGQAQTQVLLLACAAVAVVPFMLFPIPYIEWRDQQARTNAKKREEYGEAEMQERQSLLGGGEKKAVVVDETPDVDMQEVVIKQVIHCIEFVLGSVSNTASYLRLWALSLAHAQLSEVFWTFAFMLPFEVAGDLQTAGGVAVMYCGFAVWISATIGVLVLMEALSAFLHALRLHWVEFQNKFYYADGVAWDPFHFDTQLAAAELPPGPWGKAAELA
eukprot:TRINITY_DN2850_c0_g2_i3.p1 TRINITY_DN2850_c0_g2~~TRINITY_DN2850_c0_g2_i3.p1  ORF type:complete len:952 (+),score=386.32 TRINITY_DN2850_c0_g2_i3:127-2982(+)